MLFPGLRYGVRPYQRSRLNSVVDSAVLVLGMQLLSRISRLQRKPPVTLTLMGINVAIWLGFDLLSPLAGGYPRPAMCPAEIVSGLRPLSHLFLAAFVHAQDGGYHLVYNMSSLFWKGAALEQSMGSRRFAYMVTVLLLLAHALFVPVSYIATALFDTPTFYTRAVGFSAVLFALKVVVNHSRTDEELLEFLGMVFPVQARYATWVELVLISLVTPNASFVGHLCGILAGVIWLRLAQYLDQRGCGETVRRAAHRAAHEWRSAAAARPTPAWRDWGGGRLGGYSAAGHAVDEDRQFREAIRRSLREY